nr:hypothetical protein BaRGS_030057 [Batillaria attramentaria]
MANMGRQAVPNDWTVVEAEAPDINAAGVFVVGTEKTMLCYITTSETNPNGLFPLTWTRESAPNTPIAAESEDTTVLTGSLTRYTSTLKMTVTKFMNRERFYCTARLGSSVESSNWRVFAYKPPDTPAITGPTEIVSGVSNTWNCTVGGASSAPNVYFEFGNRSRAMTGVTDLGTNIRNDPDFSGYLNAESVLQIHEVSKSLTLNVAPGSNSFDLSCLAVHYDTQTQKQSTISVTVYYAPVVTGVTNYTVTVGTQATLICEASAEPDITSVTWYKDNAAIGTSSRYQGSEASSPSLIIVDVLREDAGAYKCTASNNIGTGESEIGYVTVRYVPVITYNTTTFGGDLGEDVELPCPIEANPAFTTVLWYRISELTGAKTPISASGNPTKYSGGTTAIPTLTIKSLTSADSGLYRCAADNNVGRGEGPDISVTVYYKPEISVPSEVEGDELQPVVLQCNVSALPALISLTWYKEGQLLDTSDQGRYSGGNTTTPSLTILSLAPFDAGNYYCVATNPKGTTMSTTMELEVDYKPIIVAPDEVGGNTLDTVTLEVSLSANPPVSSVLWRKQLGASNAFQTIDLNNPKYGGGTVANPSLVIANLAAGDIGVYVIEVTNPMGTVTANVTVAVSYAPTDPTITGLESVYKEGETIELTCSSDGFPTPDYRWYRDNVLYVPEGQTQGARFNDTASPANNAAFKCEAYNTKGSASTTVSVSVRYTPRPSSTLSNVTASIGDTVTLICSTDSNPAPTSYIWSRNGQVLYSGNSSTLEVTVVNSTYLGSYSCQATNSEGTSNPPIVVYVAEPPDPTSTTPATGQSTEDTGLSTATLVLIIIICIIILVVLILIIVYCCTNRKCMRKDNNVEPSRPPVAPVPHFAEKNGPHLNGFYSTVPPIKGQNGRIDMTDDGVKALPASANGSCRAISNTPGCSVPGGGTPRPHHLPPLGQDGAAEEQESAQDEKSREKKKKRRRKRHDADTKDGSPQHSSGREQENVY